MLTAIGRRANFAPFESEVCSLRQTLHAQLAADLPAYELPGYINEGRHAYVFSMTQHAGVVAKFHHNDADTPASDNAERRVQALSLGAGHAVLEQMVAYDHFDQNLPAVLCVEIEGDDLDETSRGTRASMARHFPELLRAFGFMQDRGLSADHSLGNTPFSRANGFHELDYECVEGQTLEQKVTSFAAYDMLLEGVPKRSRVPAYGLAYRDATRAIFGKAMATAVEEAWLRQGFRL